MKTSLKSLALIALVAVSSTSILAFAQEATSGKKGSTQTTAAPTAQTAEPQATASKKTKSGSIRTSRITRGTVVSLMTLKKVTAAEAGAMANKGALALMVGSRVVYVVKADGTSAGDDLARLADGRVGVAGKTISRGGATVIVASVVDVIK